MKLRMRIVFDGALVRKSCGAKEDPYPSQQSCLRVDYVMCLEKSVCYVEVSDCEGGLCWENIMIRHAHS